MQTKDKTLFTFRTLFSLWVEDVESAVMDFNYEINGITYYVIAVSFFGGAISYIEYSSKKQCERELSEFEYALKCSKKGGAKDG